MSVKLRVTAWFTLMVLLMAALVLSFVLIVNDRAAIDDPAARLVELVMDNADEVEFDNGRFDWDDLDSYERGVYCGFYDKEGTYLRGAANEKWQSGTAPQLNNGVLASFQAGDELVLVYDCYVDMDITGLWIRGMVSSEDSSGLMHTIIVLTLTILPVLLLLAVGGGWLIARSAFRPMEQIIAAAEGISDGNDLSSRLNMKKGPSEMRRLAACFDSMFERLERSFKAERQFASDASHELRTPITVILAQCDRARRKDETREEHLRSIGVIEEQGKKMSALVQSLLSLTRMQQGTERYPMKRADLSQFVRCCAADFIPGEDRGIKMSVDVEEGIETQFNQTLISRLVMNLLENAFKYGKEGGKVSLTLRKTGEMAEISVSDEGAGIPAEQQELVWQRFWQADPSRSEKGGSGLGLAMVKEIAQLHAGEAVLESEVGKGSRFAVRLPIK